MQKLLKRTGVILVFLVGYVASVFAADFYVTTNSDSGPGSLRAAIVAANSNGIGSTDRILFDISPRAQASDVTILLTSELPALTSNIVVDATKQPGNFFDSPYIKVQLRRNNGPLFFNGLVLAKVSDIEIYGIYFTNFNEESTSEAALKGAIYLTGSTNITIGAPNRGNAFAANYAGIHAPNLLEDFVENILIQSNYFGLLPNGIDSSANTFGVDLSWVKNAVVGGATANMGNVFGIGERAQLAISELYGSLLISNNRVGFNAANDFFLNHSCHGIVANAVDGVVTISDNMIGGQLTGMSVGVTKGTFSIIRNKIGTGPLGTENFGNQDGISIRSSQKGSIGSDLLSDKNDIAYSRFNGITIIQSRSISIRKNSIYCNSRLGIGHFSTITGPLRTPIITSISSAGLSGTYAPNGIIEVFDNHECKGCQGKVYLGTTTAQADGTFLYSGATTGSITVTGTDFDGSTSGFTFPLLNDGAKQIVDEQCGNGKGSIKNIEVVNTATFSWFDSNNRQVGNERDLTNVKAGFYYLIAGEVGGCEVRSPLYEVKSIDFVYKVKNAALRGSACGKTNGAVIVSSFETDVPIGFSWLDSNDVEVSKDRDLTGAMPGTYRLFGDNGQGCKMLAGTFTIEPITDLVINTGSASILGANCNQDGGSIVNVSVSGGTAPLSYQWLDENNEEVGTAPDLLNVVSGTYYLKITDIKGCTVQSDTFTIPPPPLTNKIANTFSPNGDGINDVWRIVGLEKQSEFEVRIFNRQGNLVFYTKNEPKDFDGKFNNVDLPAGVYYYLVDLKSANCKGINGSLLLIR